jgi:adenylate cyclase
VAIDFEAEGLLKGTRGKARDARRELLDRLATDGVTADELREAVEEDRLALLATERLIEGEGRRYTAEEVARESGVEVDFLIRQRQALGLPAPDPNARDFTEADLDAARRVKEFRAVGLPDEGLLEVARVMGMALAQVAGATRTLTGESLMEPGLTELEISSRFEEATRRLVPMMAPLLDYTYRLHQRDQLRHTVLGREELKRGRPARSEITVCFADLVEFTKIGERLPMEELGALTGRLGEMAREVAAPPVQLVKLIGDAAMFVSTEADPLLDAALTLVERAEKEREGFPLLRAGVAHGEALPRGGDWYGHPVNLASRITDVARPSSVLCAAEVREAAAGGFEWSSLRKRSLKGISGRQELYRVRRATGNGADGDGDDR